MKMIYNNFGYRIEFRRTGTACPPDGPKGFKGGQSKCQWFRIEDGKWNKCSTIFDHNKQMKQYNSMSEFIEELLFNDDPRVEEIKDKYPDNEDDTKESS